ncbi:response regulator [Lederbergia lenta]|uniref:response regulator n=1 Tax=Lederbergia lenta TaxID=1467 RepID=UPI00203BBA64|nr:response regulator [Lederbergia lenta]MCM3112942.1 response regulator [Lederbergia lenta]
MRVILIDDEQLALEVLEIQLKKINGIEIVGKYTNPQKAFEELERFDIDIVFLDMEMGSIHGLEFAERLMTNFNNLQIIFVTAHPQFALEAFEVNAIDYLLKPVRLERLEKSITKLREKMQLYRKGKELKVAKETCLFAKSMGDFQLYDSEKNIVKWRTKKVKELFVYLWLSKEGVHKHRLIEDLWSGIPIEKANTLIHTTVYQLRKVLKDIGISNPISFTNEQYTLNMTLKSDLSELENIIKLTEITGPNIERILQLYTGDFLEVESYSWALHEQHSIKKSFSKCLENYVLSAKDDIEQSYFVEICLEKMIELESYEERYIYLLMDHYGKTKSVKKMIALFHVFKKQWLDDLGLDVPQEMKELYYKHLNN